MPWQWADEQKLRQQPLVWEFDKEEVGVSGGKWEHLEESQLGIELRFQLNGDWLRELHRFPLTRQQLVDRQRFLEDRAGDFAPGYFSRPLGRAL